MPRNREEFATAYATFSLIDESTGQTVFSQNLQNGYVSKAVVRPDAQSRTKIQGFRSPTAWYVEDVSARPFWDGTYYERSGGGRYEYSGELLGVASDGPIRLVDFSFPLNLRSRAETECLLKIKSQKVNLSVAAAEMHKSVDMIGNRIGTLARAVAAARKGKFAKAADLLGVPKPKKGFLSKGSKNAAQGWLELTYGWMPLLQDIDGIYMSAITKQREFGQLIKAKRVLKTQSVRSVPSQLENRFDVVRQDHIEYTCVVALNYRVNNEALAAAAQVGLDNPLTVAWELTPFSFLLDWVVPIGNYIDSFTATQGLDFVGGTLTEVTRVSRVGTAKGFGNIHGQLTENQQAFRMDRTLYGTTPFPAPYYKNPWSTAHAVNALALLRSFLK